MHLDVVVDTEELRERVARPTREIDHPVHGRDELVVRPLVHQVAEIDHERALDRGRFDPLAGRVQHLEPRLVLPDGREALIIGVRADPEKGRIDLALVRRIIADAQTRHRLGVELEEMILRHVDRERHGAADARAELQLAVEIGAERPAEIRRVDRPVVRPIETDAALVVRIVGREVVRHLDRLVQVAALQRVVGLDAFERHIAAMIGRGEIVDAHLLLERKREEALHGFLGPPDHTRRKGVVLDVEKADMAARVADRLRHLLALRQARRIDSAEIHHRHFVNREPFEAGRVQAFADLERRIERRHGNILVNRSTEQPLPHRHARAKTQASRLKDRLDCRVKPGNDDMGRIAMRRSTSSLLERASMVNALSMATPSAGETRRTGEGTSPRCRPSR